MSECEARGTDYGLSGLRHHPTYGPAATAQEERVARAICQSAVDNTPSMMTPAGKAMFVASHWPNHVAGARAAIAAFPEPPKLPPVEGDEAVLRGTSRHFTILAIKDNPLVGKWAWVEYLDGKSPVFETLNYEKLERA